MRGQAEAVALPSLQGQLATCGHAINDLHEYSYNILPPVGVVVVQHRTVPGRERGGFDAIC